MYLAFDECECGHDAIDHYWDPVTEDMARCSGDCDCKTFVKKFDPTLGPYDHVPN